MQILLLLLPAISAEDSKERDHKQAIEVSAAGKEVNWGDPTSH